MIIGIDAHNLEGNRTGVGRYLINLLQQWSKLNFQFPISNFQFILYFKDKIPADLPNSPVFETRLLKVRSTAKFVHWNLWRALKKDKVDTLFCPGYIAPIFWRGKLALSLHDIIYEAHPEWFEWKNPADKILLKWVSKKIAKQADIIFTISEFSRQEIINYYKISPQKIILTPLAVDSSLSAFKTPPHPIPFQGEGVGEEVDSLVEIKQKFGIKDKFVFFVASIFERRHLSEIIEAFKKLNRPDYQLLIGGRDYTADKKVDKMSAKINEELGRDAILRVDFIVDAELKLLYSACTFFIWLSDYEGFGLPVLEAMANSVPVITSDSTSLKEVAGNAALLIKNNSDTEEIYRTMKLMTIDESLRQTLIGRGRERVKKFSWERCARITLGKLMSI